MRILSLSETAETALHFSLGSFLQSYKFRSVRDVQRAQWRGGEGGRRWDGFVNIGPLGFYAQKYLVNLQVFIILSSTKGHQKNCTRDHFQIEHDTT